MAIRNPTNTLILTNVASGTLNDPSPLVEFLSKKNYTIELVALPKFGRILVICDITENSQEVLQSLKLSSEWGYLGITYSIRDNHWSILDSDADLFASKVDSKDYLELPLEDGSRRFLISPPLSPPAEWDHWDRVEEGPNSKSVYSPQDLSHLLWERLGGLQSSDVRKYQDEDIEENEYEIRDMKTEPEVLFEDIDNGVPAIVLDTVNNKNKSDALSKKPIAKTSIPPPLD